MNMRNYLTLNLNKNLYKETALFLAVIHFTTTYDNYDVYFVLNQHTWLDFLV